MQEQLNYLNRKTYSCLSTSVFKSNEFLIKPVSPEEIESIRIWRNLQMDVLRQKKPIGFEEQIDYFQKNIWPLFEQKQPSQILFSFYENEKLLGYGGLVHISWENKRSEMSFLLNPDHIKNNIVYKKYFSEFISFMKKINFEELGFHKLYTETYSHRDFHIEILIENNFVLEGVLKDHIYIKDKFINSLIHSIIKNV